MDNQEFDKALQEYVKSSELPYDPLQWEKMEGRLKAHEERKTFLPMLGKTISLHRWVGVGAAACLLVMLGWYIKELQPDVKYNVYKEPGAKDRTINVRSHADTETKERETTEAASQAIASAANHATSHGKSTTSTEAEKGVVSRTLAVQEVVDTTSRTVEQQHVAADQKVQPQLPQRRNELPSYDLPDEPERRAIERKMAYGISGGYNLAKGQNNFTLGVNVKRKLSNKLHLETAIAFVSGSQESHVGASASAIVGLKAQSVTTYEPVKTNLLYLQAAPTLNYRLLPGFSAGGGVDAQRLLTNPDAAVSISSMGEQEPSQPQWDFGLTGRLDYQVLKKLKAGVMYRESVGAVTKDGSDAVKRNYLLMQLSYTIY